MAEKLRKEYATLIHHHNASLSTPQFREMGLIETENKFESLKRAFADFTEQHTYVLGQVGTGMRVNQEIFYNEIHRVYSKMVTAYRRRIDTLEREQMRVLPTRANVSFSRAETQNVQTAASQQQKPTPIQQQQNQMQPRQQSRASCTVTSAQAETVQTLEPGEIIESPIRERSRSPVRVRSEIVRAPNDLRNRIENGGQRVQRTPRAERLKKPLKCTFCNAPHPMFACPTFLGLAMDKRWERVKEMKLCENCLLPKIERHRCRAGPCRRCGPDTRHNSVLCSRGFY